MEISICSVFFFWKLPLYISRFLQFWYILSLCSNKKIKVDQFEISEILRLIKLTISELECHKTAIASGQLTQDQKDCQLNIKKLTLNQQVEEDLNRKECFSEKLRRKSVSASISLGTQIKHSLKRRQSQIIRKKVVSYKI